jgi:hypothetical protein
MHCDYKPNGNVQCERVFKHSTNCKALKDHDPDTFRDVTLASKNGSLGAQLEDTVSESSQPGPTTSLCSSESFGAQKGLSLPQLCEAGKKKKEELLKAFQAKVDHIVMWLICVRGLVPNLIDSPEWKELMHTLNGQYHPTSSDTFSDKYIPREAVFVRKNQIMRLKAENNLTLTFDGTTIRKPESFYTAHATTPSRQTYFLDGHEGTNEHHHAQWIKDKLLSVREVILTLIFSQLGFNR